MFSDPPNERKTASASSLSNILQKKAAVQVRLPIRMVLSVLKLCSVDNVNDAVIGNHEWKGKIDLINIIMIGIAKELPEQDERYELHRLLGALLSQNLTVDEKMSIMETEYDIELEENLRRDVSTMCNLSEGIEEKGIAIGEARAEASMIARMHKNGMQPEQIAAVTEKSIEEVRKIIADCENG